MGFDEWYWKINRRISDKSKIIILTLLVILWSCAVFWGISYNIKRSHRAKQYVLEEKRMIEVGWATKKGKILYYNNDTLNYIHTGKWLNGN